MDLRCDKCGKYLSIRTAHLNQLAGATRAPGGGRPQQADEEGEEIFSNSTLAEEADEATKLSKLPRLTLIWKNSSVISATTQTLLKGITITCVGEALTWHGPQANLRCDKCGKHFRTMDVTPPQYLRTSPLKQLAGATRAPGGGPAPEDWGGGRGELQPEQLLRLVTLLKKQWMSMKLLRPESVEEIEPAEYAENTEKSGNTIRVSEISIFTLEVEKLMRLLI